MRETLRCHSRRAGEIYQFTCFRIFKGSWFSEEICGVLRLAGAYKMPFLIFPSITFTIHLSDREQESNGNLKKVFIILILFISKFLLGSDLGGRGTWNEIIIFVLTQFFATILSFFRVWMAVQEVSTLSGNSGENLIRI